MAVFNEKVYLYDRNENSSEFHLSAAGLLSPDKNYVVAREKSDNNIIEFVVSGAGFIEVDGITSRVRAGDCYCLRKGSSHKYYSDENDPYTKMWINISGTLPDAWLNLYDVTLTPYIKRLDISEQWQRLRDCIESGGTHETIMLLVHEIIFRLSRAPIRYGMLNKTEETHYKDRRRFILDVKKYIEKSATSALSIDELSAAFAISRSQLIRMFKKEYGITPYAYAMECRLQIAKTLLETSDLSIDEIAAKLCFCDRNHLNKLFIGHYGLSPAAYRKSVFKT